MNVFEAAIKIYMRLPFWPVTETSFEETCFRFALAALSGSMFANSVEKNSSSGLGMKSTYWITGTTSIPLPESVITLARPSSNYSVYPFRLLANFNRVCPYSISREDIIEQKIK